MTFWVKGDKAAFMRRGKCHRRLQMLRKQLKLRSCVQKLDWNFAKTLQKRHVITGTEISYTYPKYGVPIKMGGVSCASMTLMVRVDEDDRNCSLPLKLPPPSWKKSHNINTHFSLGRAECANVVSLVVFIESLHRNVMGFLKLMWPILGHNWLLPWRWRWQSVPWFSHSPEFPRPLCGRCRCVCRW